MSSGAGGGPTARWGSAAPSERLLLGPSSAVSGSPPVLEYLSHLYPSLLPFVVVKDALDTIEPSSCRGCALERADARGTKFKAKGRVRASSATTTTRWMGSKHQLGITPRRQLERLWIMGHQKSSAVSRTTPEYRGHKGASWRVHLTCPSRSSSAS